MRKSNLMKTAARRCHRCGDSYDKKYLVQGWLLATHPIYCPVTYKATK
jgi:hypothetical protein